MSAHSLQDLADQLGDAMGVVAPTLAAQANGGLAFSLVVRGVLFSVTHDELSHGDDAVIHVFFGNLPPAAEFEAMEALLSTNLQMRAPRAPAFGLDCQRREVVLRYPYSLSTASGHGLQYGFQVIADTVLRWRSDHFVDVPQAIPDRAQLA